jgi:hypothetical protein
MRPRITMAATVAVTAMAGLAVGASAAPPHNACAIGPGGSGNTGNSAWQLTDEPTLGAAIEAAGGGADDVAAIFVANDKNGDELLCVLTQTLPNDASGAETFFVFHDNTANARKS